MGLDVYLYQFKGLDTDAILRIWRFSEEPWAFEAFKKWNSLSQSERGTFPSEKDKMESREILIAEARELGLPEWIVGQESFGGVNISFSSKQHPQWMVGDWYSLSTTRAIMERFTGKELYYVFPEARDGSRLFRPNWLDAKKRLTELLEALKKLESPQLDDFMAGLSESLNHHLSQVEVMIETVDFVLNSDNSDEFLLLWSD
jgi:hypothetical protein